MMTASPPSEAPSDSPVGAAVELLRRGREKYFLADISDFQEAVALYLEAGELRPGDPRVNVALAEAYSYWGSRRAAGGQECASFFALSHEQACRAVSAAPNLPEAHRAMAASLRSGKNGDPVLRKKEAALALRMNPYDGENCYEFWRATGHEPTAALIDKTLALSPRLSGAFNALGAAWARRGRFHDAAYYFDKTLALNPRHALALCNLARALIEQGFPDRARTVMRRAEKFHPRDPLVLRSLKLVCESGRKEDLRHELEFSAG